MADIEKLERYRGALAKMGSRITFALSHQGDDEDRNESDLLEVLKGVEATASLAVKGLEVK